MKIFLFILSTIAYISFARDALTPTQPLADDEVLVSAGGTFALGFFTPTGTNNRYVGMWYNKVAERRIVWVANRASPAVNSTGLLSITANSTMMITDQNSKAIIWSIGNTSGLTSPSAQLLDTGNFVLKQDGNDTVNYTWQSFEHPTDTLLSGMKIGRYWNSGIIINLKSWKSEVDPSAGEYYIAAEEIRVYLYSSSGKVWRNGPLDGLYFRDKGPSYSYVNNSKESTFSFVQAKNEPAIIVASVKGTVQFFAMSSDSQRWDLLAENLANQCDRFGLCGPNGICNVNASPLCSCLQGYVPKNPHNWALGDWADGCVAKTGLDCRNGTDGFVVVSGVKIPDLPTFLTSTAFSLDECRLMCLRDCSCTAYAQGALQECLNWLTDSLLDTVLLQDLEQDLFIRVPSSYLASNQHHKKTHKKAIILVSLLLGTVTAAAAACVACFLLRRKSRRKVVTGVTNTSTGKSNESCAYMDIPLFDFATIEAATDNFSAEKELGQGGFGTVYKGELGDGQVIAAKRLVATSLQGNDEFMNEVNLIAKLQNINLVRLLGCCIQEEEKMLIYEYMPNKSLDAFLYDKEKSALLDWQTRYQIIIGISRGLLYLHHDSMFRIIHRDLKASNILLDNRMNPKIADFGMARLFGGDETDFNTKRIVGTYGYMSPEYAMEGSYSLKSDVPEYAMEGSYSLKSDVFSFGVLVLEIVSGKKNRGGNAPSAYLNLVAEVWSLWLRGESLKVVDGSMSQNFSANTVLRCIKVGLLCVQENPIDRPLMSSVIVMLGADVASLPEPKQPGFATRICTSKLEKDKNEQDMSVSNELTVTMEGR